MRHCLIISLLATGTVGCELAETSYEPRLGLKRTQPVERLLDEAPASEIPETESLSEGHAKHIAWDVIPSNTEIPHSTLELSDTLQRLHATTLTAFEAAPNFGSQRMPPIIREASPPRHVPMLRVDRSVESGGWEVERPAYLEGPGPSQAWNWLKLMSGVSRNGFVYRPYEVYSNLPSKEYWNKPPGLELVVDGFPISNPDNFRGFADKLSALSSQNELWKIASLELIGLSEPENPIVFQHRHKRMTEAPEDEASREESEPADRTNEELLDDQTEYGWFKVGVDPERRSRRVNQSFQQESNFSDPDLKVETRPVNDLETFAIKKLIDGTEIAATLDSDKSVLRMLSAIRASESCKSCHAVEAGTLLGAFTFQLERLPSNIGATSQLCRLDHEANDQLKEVLRKNITLKLNNVAVMDAITQILTETGGAVSINAEALEEFEISASTTVSGTWNGLSAFRALWTILDQLDLVYHIDGNVMLISRRTIPTF